MKKIFIILLITSLGLSPVFSQNNKLSEAEMMQMIDECVDSIDSPDFMSIEKRVKKTMEDNNYAKGIVKINKAKMFYYYLHGNTDSLEKYTNIAKDISKKHDSMYDYFDSWSYLTNHYVLIGQNIKALNNAKEMQEEAIKADSNFGIGSSAMIIGDTYAYMELYDEALNSYKLAEETYKKDNDPLLLGDLCNLYFSVCIVYLLSERYNDIFPISDKIDSCTVINEKYDHNPANISYNLVAMCSRSMAYSKLGDLSNAEICLNKARKLYSQRDFQTDYMLEAEAVFFDASGRFKEAIEINNKIIRFYDDMGLKREKMRFILFNADLYKKIGLYKKACDNYRLYIDSVKIINTSESFIRVNEYSVINNIKALELDKKNLEISMAKQKNNTILSFAILLSIIVIVVCFYFIREHILNKKLNIAIKEAKKSDTLKSAFLANMSHEIRTPLNSIVGFSELISETDDKDEKEQYKNIIKMNSHQLLGLVNDILDLSKIEAGTITIKEEHFDIVPYLRDLYKSFSSLPTKKENVHFILDVNEDSRMVNLDRDRLSQIYTNFITNAFKFTPEGEVKVGYRMKDNGICIFVSDTGKGIAKDKINLIFNRFYKGDDFSNGNGLGMSICKALVTSNGGKIGVESQEGEGSTFWAWLPQ
jgi:signal transduction histidine kinase